MRRTAAIVQSSYIPWKGYFDIINRADEFVLYDDAQYTARDWRNRNRIKTAQGLLWLTVPVHGGRVPIRDVTVVEDGWPERHWASLRHAYARAPFFEHYAPAFEALYRRAAEADLLSTVNGTFIHAVCNILGIDTRLHFSFDLPIHLPAGADEKLIAMCETLGCDRYLSGPAARAYMDPAKWKRAWIEVEFMEYQYPEYPQLHGPFEHGVSVLDLLFNTGHDARRYM